jgi:hypothetical protein
LRIFRPPARHLDASLPFLERCVRRLISKNALEAACFIASELSTPHVQPGHSRRIIEMHCRE